MITIEILQVCSAFVLSLSSDRGLRPVSTSPSPRDRMRKTIEYRGLLKCLGKYPCAVPVSSLWPCSLCLTIYYLQGPGALKRKRDISHGVSGGSSVGVG